MAVGVAFAGMLAKSESITLAGAMALSLGIAIQNFPEGAVISLPLKEAAGQKKAFVYGMLSGYCRAHRRRSYAVIGRKTGALYAIFPFLCSRCHALRSSGELVPEASGRGTFQYWYHRICHWVCIDDGP